MSVELDVDPFIYLVKRIRGGLVLYLCPLSSKTSRFSCGLCAQGGGRGPAGGGAGVRLRLSGVIRVSLCSTPPPYFMDPSPS